MIERRRRTAAMYCGKPQARNVTYSTSRLGDIRIGIFEPDVVRTDTVVFYVHGGGYRLGSVDSFAALTSHISSLLGSHLVSVDYRLAPEMPFPTAYEDTIAAYRWTVEELTTGPVIVMGDSAGGGLAAGAMLEARQSGLRMPSAGVLFSPWLDLRNSAESFSTEDTAGDTFPLSEAIEAASLYLAGSDPADVRASPLFGDWSEQPPLLVTASRNEGIRDDAVRLARVARSAGVDCELKLYEGTKHGWWNDYPTTPQSRQLLEDVAHFVGSIVM